MSTILIYCRPGFEADCAEELQFLAARGGFGCDVRTVPETGQVEAELAGAGELHSRHSPVRWRDLVFARQMFEVLFRATGLPDEDRVTPILQQLRRNLVAARCLPFTDVFVECPDTNEGKRLIGFCKQFEYPLRAALTEGGLLDPAASSDLRLHVFFLSWSEAVVGIANRANSAPWPMGIPRLKFPAGAPSRSVLKLDEAFNVLLRPDEQKRWLRPGAHAVDLGAAPGGWSFLLAKRGLRVLAVDRAKLAREVLSTGLVTHVPGNAYEYEPPRPTDWLVCDVVDQPQRIARLMARWLGERMAKRAIFNLKLPMKRRWAMVKECLDFVRTEMARHGFADDDIILRSKQLYHDRREVSVFLGRRG
ncbi:MAG: 23S rRNA (cytidine(2498)-2'-O)-methyltransferase RlmM [Lentisphaerae bacterium RIFOXYB12_FULL_65_16]|nr:MAG: 23S rRNA (cytidine(2498)-2'-O)-methyltransferase RlmM [Lentisphaerae bacterium RIFOXYA12_64_32]OGV92717.1 MAG: 23S rRNA (cytidine(2498)-2'-O)-methyltransferase RlmM [Lentisphaerae bacterium RIFOXYB12_FULL_65_16]